MWGRGVCVGAGCVCGGGVCVGGVCVWGGVWGYGLNACTVRKHGLFER